MCTKLDIHFLGFLIFSLHCNITLPIQVEAIFKFAYNLRSMNSQSSDGKADCIKLDNPINYGDS